MGAWTRYHDLMKVTVPEGEVDGLRIEKFEVTGRERWNRYDERMYGRGCKPGTYIKLVDYSKEDHLGRPLLWMSDTTAERNDHAEPLAYIEAGEEVERVLINGLGLGMVLSGVLSYLHVKHVDVVEADKRVIELVGPHYLKDDRVRIHHADAYEQTANWPRGTRWDVAWSDIWPDISDENIEGMDRLHKFYRPRTVWHGMWARKRCLALRRQRRALGLE